MSHFVWPCKIDSWWESSDAKMATPVSDGRTREKSFITFIWRFFLGWDSSGCVSSAPLLFLAIAFVRHFFLATSGSSLLDWRFFLGLTSGRGWTVDSWCNSTCASERASSPLFLIDLLWRFFLLGWTVSTSISASTEGCSSQINMFDCTCCLAHCSRDWFVNS